ncbi:MAG: hypothetical protein Q9186_005016 [Xanthomendoza sp. 1 TL-2023]
MATRVNDEAAHFVERKILESKRSAGKGYICPYCSEGFVQEPRLWEHAKEIHWNSLDSPPRLDDGQLRKQLRIQAVEKASTATRKSIRTSGQLPPEPLLEDYNPYQVDIGDEVGGPGSPPMSVSTPGLGHSGSQVESPKRIHDFGKLTLGQTPSRQETFNAPGNTFSTTNPLKRRPTETLEVRHLESKGHVTGHTASATRREKALSAGSFPNVSPPNDGNESKNPYNSTKRMYLPYMDDANYNANLPGKEPSLEKPINVGRLPNAKVFEVPHDGQLTSPNAYSSAIGPESRTSADQNATRTKHSTNGVRSGSRSWDTRQHADIEIQPRMLLQPETRPISHAQLVVEVKGIYHGLVLVEQKCIEVDEKQSAAALERDPSKRTDLKDEQWQALIALHRTLLHEHHDFFLASQHPSASPPLTYSMMALLYETVIAFEDTWIECLGDLGRYRMAIEDSNSGDREIWGGVARSWYNKAADKRPEVGRLYHHLAILARPFSLSQLAYYTRSLSSVEPFDSARGSIMTLYQPVLDGKTYNNHRVKALEIAYIKVHGILFDRPQDEEAFQETVASIRDGLLDGYIDRVTSNFKEQGLYIAVANIAAFFECGGSSQLHRSIFRQAFSEAKKLRDEKSAPESQRPTDTAFSLDGDSKAASPNSPLTTVPSAFESPSDNRTSSFLISKASELAFTTLSIALRRHGDKNVFPFIHCMFVFLWNLASIGSIMEYVRADVPWDDVCSFLNTLARPEAMTPAVLNSDAFPRSNDKIEPPLPEDYFMRGQVFVLDYLPIDWTEKNSVDEEERMLELPSMTATRVDRLLWLGIRIARLNKWIYYDTVVHTFRPISDANDVQRLDNNRTC